MTTVRAASSATLNVALVPRRAAARQEVVRREVHLREAVPHHVRLRETLAVGAVAPPAMTTMIIIHRAAVAEAEGGSFCHKTDKTNKTLF